MKFLHLFGSSNKTAFDNIIGYDDLKEIVNRTLSSDENYNLLFVGPPASSFTLFLEGILLVRGFPPQISLNSIIIDLIQLLYVII